MRADALAPKSSGLDNRTIGWALLLAAALLSLYFLFSSGIRFIWFWWGGAEYSHGPLIPLITAFIVWQRRKVIMAERGAGSWAGLALVLVGLAVLFFGEIAVLRRLPAAGFVIVLMGLCLAALGPRAMRHLWVPLAFLFFAMPLPGTLYVPLAMKLQFISSELGAAILRLVGVSVFLDGNVIDLGSYKLQVAEACSGLRYLFPLSAFAFLCAWLYRAPLWAKALVLLSTIPLTIVMNSARIALTGVFMEYGSTELAEGFMHLFEGWVVFLIVLVLLFLLMWLLALLSGSKASPLDLLDFDRLSGATGPVQRAGTLRAAPAVPFVLAVAALVVAAPFSNAFANRSQHIPARPALAEFPMELGDWQGRPIPLDDQTQRALGASDSLLVDFAQGGTGIPVNMWLAYYATQVDESSIHSPKDCLPGGGWEYVSIQEIDAPATTSAGHGFKLNRALIAKGQERMMVYYWLDMRGRQLTNDLSLKFYNLWDSFSMQRSDGALVRLMTYVDPNETPEQAEQRLRSFLATAYPVMEPQFGY